MFFRDEPQAHPSGGRIRFQVIDWYQTDFEDEVDEGEVAERSYIIKMFGVTEEGYSVCANIEGFEPFFYISGYNIAISNGRINALRAKIKERLRKALKDQFTMKVIHKKSIWGFTNNEKRQYIKFSFTNLTCMYMVRKYLREMNEYQFHESNIDPFLRFVHAQELQPCGWVSIQEADDVNEETPLLATKSQINVRASHDSVFPYESNSVAPVVIMSFDIECTSHSGDFPVPIKTYRKTAEQMIEYYRKLQSHKDEQGRYNWLNSKTKMSEALIDIFRKEDNDPLNLKPLS